MGGAVNLQGAGHGLVWVEGVTRDAVEPAGGGGHGLVWVEGVTRDAVEPAGGGARVSMG